MVRAQTLTSRWAKASILQEMACREYAPAGEHRNGVQMHFVPATDTAAAPRVDPSRLGLSFAGIDFTFEGPAPLLNALAEVPLAVRSSALPAPGGADLNDLSTPPIGAPSVAEVRCGLTPARQNSSLSRAKLGPRGVEWEWSGDAGQALTEHAEVRWQVDTGGRVNAEAMLSPNPRAAESLLTALASALLHGAGGAILHAASVELACGVVAFVGRSGAGKSTACEHVNGARQFSLDRLAVVPAVSRQVGHAGWMAHPLPGGTRSERGLPDSVPLGRPLRAILGVHKAASGCELSRCATDRAVAMLRAAAFHANRQPGAELELLAHLERLARELPVGNLHLSLGTSLEPILGRWLVGA